MVIPTSLFATVVDNFMVKIFDKMVVISTEILSTMVDMRIMAITTIFSGNSHHIFYSVYVLVINSSYELVVCPSCVY